MDKELIAFTAAQRIIDEVEAAGYDLSQPGDIWKNFEWCGSLGCNRGASRLVIWDDQYDYVIKVALVAEYEKYCQHEVEVYADAERAGVSEYFGWCKCYQEPEECGYGIYVMEYLDGNEDEVYDSAWLYGYKQYCEARGLDSSNYDNADDYDNWNYDEEENMLLEYMESYMTSEQRKVFGIMMNKWRITDIHRANVLYKNGHLALIDYAGWGW